MIDGNAFGGYPGYNFLQGMGGPSGFSGQMPGQSPMLGQGIMQGDQPQMPHQHHGGFNPLMMLSPFAALMSHNPKMGMAMMSPLAGLFGAFK